MANYIFVNRENRPITLRFLGFETILLAGENAKFRGVREERVSGQLDRIVDEDHDMVIYQMVDYYQTADFDHIEEPGKKVNWIKEGF